MRVFALLLSVLALTGCNQVLSEAPLFSTADEAGASPLREGLWANVGPDCAVRPTRSSDPPACDRMVIRGHLMADPAKPGDSYPFVLASGAPRILQLGWRDSAKDDTPPYAYAGLKGLRRDRAGRIIEAMIWPAACGPLTDQEGPGLSPPAGRSGVTVQPLPGLIMADDNCLAQYTDAVRRSARASRAWTHQPTRILWIGEGGD